MLVCEAQLGEDVPDCGISACYSILMKPAIGDIHQSRIHIFAAISGSESVLESSIGIQLQRICVMVWRAYMVAARWLM